MAYAACAAPADLTAPAHFGRARSPGLAVVTAAASRQRNPLASATVIGVSSTAVRPPLPCDVGHMSTSCHHFVERLAASGMDKELHMMQHPYLACLCPLC